MTGLTDAMRSDFRVMKVSMGYHPHHHHHPKYHQYPIIPIINTTSNPILSPLPLSSSLSPPPSSLLPPLLSSSSPLLSSSSPPSPNLLGVFFSGSRCSYESDSDAKRRMYEKVPGQCQFNPGSKFAQQALPRLLSKHILPLLHPRLGVKVC